MTLEPIDPRAPPNRGATLLIAPVIPLPTPPKTPPNAVPTPGIKAATGATFLTTLPIPLINFLKNPYSGKPVCGFNDAIPEPTTCPSGSRLYSINLRSSMASNSGSSSIICGGTMVSPNSVWIKKLSCPVPRSCMP